MTLDDTQNTEQPAETPAVAPAPESAPEPVAETPAAPVAVDPAAMPAPNGPALSEHDDAEDHHYDSAPVGVPVQFYTKDAAQQFADMGEGPYAAVVTKRLPDGYVALRVSPPGLPSYDVPAVPPHDADQPLARWYHSEFA